MSFGRYKDEYLAHVTEILCGCVTLAARRPSALCLLRSRGRWCSISANQAAAVAVEV